MLAVDAFAAGKTCPMFRRAAAHGPHHGRSLLRVLPRGSQAILDIDDTFDAVHGGQQLRLFNAHYDEYGFSRSSRSTARVASSPPRCVGPSGRGGKEARAFLRRLLRASRANWPHTEILLRRSKRW